MNIFPIQATIKHDARIWRVSIIKRGIKVAFDILDGRMSLDEAMDAMRKSYGNDVIVTVLE